MSGVADQSQLTVFDVLHAADIVEHGVVMDVVVKRVGGEIAANRIFLDFTESIVAQDAPVIIGLVFRGVFVVAPKRGDFDNIATEADVHQAKATPDDAAVFK